MPVAESIGLCQIALSTLKRNRISRGGLHQISPLNRHFERSVRHFRNYFTRNSIGLVTLFSPYPSHQCQQIDRIRHLLTAITGLYFTTFLSFIKFYNYYKLFLKDI